MPYPRLFCDLLCSLVLAANSPTVKIVVEEAPTTTGASLKEFLQDRPAPVAASAEPIPPSSQSLEQEKILTQLRTQATLRDCRQLFEEQRFGKVIEKLESSLAQAEGSEVFLTTLAEAYRGRIDELLGQRKPNEARLLVDRLRLITSGDSQAPVENTDPKTLRDTLGNDSAPSGGGDAETNRPNRSDPDLDLSNDQQENLPSIVKKSIPVAIAKTRSSLAARGKIEDRPSLLADSSAADKATSALQYADELFGNRRYAEALPCYERAYEIDSFGVQVGRQRWGYCLLFVSIQRYNELIEQATPVGTLTWANLETDVKLARKLAPSLEKYATDTLAAIEARQSASPQPSSLRMRNAECRLRHEDTKKIPQSAFHIPHSENPNRYHGSPLHSIPSRSFRHLPYRSQSWSVLQTANFLIHHRDPVLAEEIAQLAEQARRFAHQKWFPNEPLEVWTPRCEIHLYPTAHEYSRATGVSPQSPGHTSVMNDGGRILSRKLLLRTDDPNIKHAVLPHEITHVVLAGRFGRHTLPRWADEGIAVLTEPGTKQEGHLSNLCSARQSGLRFTCAQIMTMDNYPPGGRMRNFYAHSVGICRYLVELGGSEKLVEFLRTSLRIGNYEIGLQQVYGLGSFGDLEIGFERFVADLATSHPPLAVLGRSL